MGKRGGSWPWWGYKLPVSDACGRQGRQLKMRCAHRWPFRHSLPPVANATSSLSLSHPSIHPFSQVPPPHPTDPNIRQLAVLSVTWPSRSGSHTKIIIILPQSECSLEEQPTSQGVRCISHRLCCKFQPTSLCFRPTNLWYVHNRFLALFINNK